MKFQTYIVRDQSPTPNNGGNAGRKIALGVCEDSDQVEVHRAFFEKILAKTSWNDCEIQLTSLDSFHDYWSIERCSILILFGLRPKQLGFQFEEGLHHPLHVAGITCIQSVSIDQLSEDVSQKKALWNALQLAMKHIT